MRYAVLVTDLKSPWRLYCPEGTRYGLWEEDIIDRYVKYLEKLHPDCNFQKIDEKEALKCALKSKVLMIDNNKYFTGSGFTSLIEYAKRYDNDRELKEAKKLFSELGIEVKETGWKPSELGECEEMCIKEALAESVRLGVCKIGLKRCVLVDTRMGRCLRNN